MRGLLTGGGWFADDMSLPGQAYVYIVRSPHAHARIAGIDTGPAEQMPGVITALTGSDAEGDGLQPIPHRPVSASPQRCRSRVVTACPFSSHPVLVVGKVWHVSEAITIVVAETNWLHSATA
jgi:carbon-monoxide dehydrogenase large subunit